MAFSLRNTGFDTMLYLVGVLLLTAGAFMLIPLIVAVLYGEPVMPFVWGVVCNVVLGVGLCLWNKQGQGGIDHFEDSDMFSFVGIIWIVVPVFSSIPYIRSGLFQSGVEALFESVSGYTATGWSMLTNLDLQPRSILLWRSLTQWFGGLGLTFVLILLVKKMGKGVNQLYNLEFREPGKDKMYPHIASTVKRMYFVYVVLTLLQFLLLVLGNMSVFDALCYSLSTISSGGFGIHDNGMQDLSMYSQYIVILFMLLCSINYIHIYGIFRKKVENRKKGEHLRKFLTLVLIMSLILGTYFFLSGHYDWEKSLRYGLFQITSLLSATGFVLEPQVFYPMGFAFLFFILMFIGSNADRTNNTIKLVRITLLMKFIRAGIAGIFHTRVVAPVKYNGYVVRDEIINKIFGFVFLYIMVYVVGVVLLLCAGNEFYGGMVLSASALGNIGPVAGTFYPFVSMEHMNIFSKVVMMLLMIIGRVEIYSFFAIFMFRKKR